MNRLQGVSELRNYFVSLNYADRIDPATVLWKTEYTHPVFDRGALAAQHHLPSINAESSGQRVFSAAVISATASMKMPSPRPCNARTRCAGRILGGEICHEQGAGMGSGQGHGRPARGVMSSRAGRPCPLGWQRLRGFLHRP